MTLAPGRSPIVPLICVTISVRMYAGLNLNLPNALNALWLCPLMGFIIFLPFVWSLDVLAKTGNDSPLGILQGRAPRGLADGAKVIFALLLLWDAAAMIRLTASSCNVVSLNNFAIPFLILPLAIAVFAAARLGLEAVGDCARVWLKLLPLLLVIVLLVQLRSYQIYWLTPIFGGGLKEILSGGVYCAGCMALGVMPWMIAVPDRNRRPLLPYVLFSALASSLLLISHVMLCPAQIGDGLTQAARVELLLSNGRLMLSPQLVVNILWFASMLFLISAEAVGAASYLRLALPKAPAWLWPLLAGLVSLILPIWNPLWLKGYVNRVGLVFAFSGAILALLMVAALPGKEKKSNAKA